MSKNIVELKIHSMRSFILSPIGAGIIIIVLIIIISVFDILVSRSCREQAQRLTKSKVVSATDQEKRELPNIQGVDTQFREQHKCEIEHKFLGIFY